MAQNNSNGKGRGWKFYVPLVLIILIVLSGAAYWYKEYSKYISTDDAYIDSDQVALSSKILGRVNALYGDEGDTVKQGFLLAELDSSDLIAQRNQAHSAEKQAEASKQQAEANYKYGQENIKVLDIALERAKEDFARSKEQFDGNVITKESFSHTKKALETAQAQLDAAQSQLLVLKSQIETATASINTANSQINVIETNLKNTKLYAPIDGIVAKRWLLSGDIAQAGQSIMTLTKNNKLWVTIYLEETNLAEVHINQKVLFDIDAFPGVRFWGKINFIGSNTASQFSLIPPNNASGNFTKVTQRIPVKVLIEGTENNKDINSYKILSGMSVVAKIVRDK